MDKLGLVNVTLEIGGQSVTMDVSPLQASILHLFSLKPRWNLCDIGQVYIFSLECTFTVRFIAIGNNHVSNTTKPAALCTTKLDKADFWGY